MSDARAALIDALRRHALKTDGPFTLASGIVTDWYMDARLVTFSGTGAPVVAAAVNEVLDGEVAAVGGMTMGADPISFAVAFLSNGALDAFSIRKAVKDHGMGGRLVGPVESGTKVAIVEDTTSTGAAFAGAVDVALEHGLDVIQAIVLFDRSDGAAAQALAQRGVPYVPLSVPEDLGVSL